MNANGRWSRLRAPAALATVAVVAAVAGVSASKGAAHSKDVEWAAVNNTLDGQRYSPLTDINKANVKDLKVAWQFRVPKVPGTEAYPVVVGGTAYLTTTYGNIYAVDAATGKKRWSLDVTKLKNGRVGGLAANNPHGLQTRGVAVAAGRVYAVTPNSLLLALDQAKGKIIWKRSIGDPFFLSETAAPIYYDGKLYVGSAGGDNGLRGFEAAFNAATGKQVWRTYTVPSPDVPGSWVHGHHGGGTIWMNATIDTKTDRVYVATGNPGSDYDGRLRPGPNHWSNSILALDAQTGKLLWGYQQEPHDLWDFDSASPPVLFPTSHGLGVGEASKGGYWHEVDAATGKRLAKPVAFVYEDRRVPKPGGPPVVVWPSSNGGSEYSPVPFDPQTGLVYVSGNNAPQKLSIPKKPALYEGHGGLDLGGSGVLPGPWMKRYPLALTGTFTAIDVKTGKIRWQKKEPVGLVGGATATAGGLVFVGVSGKQLFQALDARTGRVLWQHRLGGRVDDAASVYSVGGKQYVLVGSGGSTFVAPLTGGTATLAPATFTAFALNQ